MEKHQFKRVKHVIPGLLSRILLGGISICAVSLILCSDNPTFEQSSNLGVPFLSDTDSSITDFDKNFKAVDVFCPVKRISSMPGTAFTASPGHFKIVSTLKAGKWQDEKAVSYMEFPGESLIRLLNNTLNSITSLRFQIKARKVWTTGTDTPEFELLLMTGLQYYDTLADTVYDTISGKFISGSDSTLYIDLQPGIVDTIVSKMEITYDTNYDTNKTTGVVTTSIDTICEKIGLYLEADSLFSFNSHLAASGKPTIKFSYTTRDSAAAALRSDSLVITSSYSDYRMTDTSGGMSGRLDTSAVSSSASGRYAIMRLDMRPFWRQLEDSNTGMEYRNILRTVINVSTDSGRITPDTLKKFNFFCGLSDAGAKDLDTSANTLQSILADTINGRIEFMTDSCVLLNVNDMITVKPESCDLFISIPNPDVPARLFWTRLDSLRIRSVFSNPW